MTIIETRRELFFRTVISDKLSEGLKESSLTGSLEKWTKLLTVVVVSVCEQGNWIVAAKGNKWWILNAHTGQFEQY